MSKANNRITGSIQIWIIPLIVQLISGCAAWSALVGSENPQRPDPSVEPEQASGSAINSDDFGAWNEVGSDQTVVDGTPIARDPAAPSRESIPQIRPFVDVNWKALEDDSVQFIVQNLPAITVDGAWVAIPVETSQCSVCSYNGLTIRFFEVRSGREAGSIMIADGGEIEGYSYDDDPQSKASFVSLLRGRIAAVSTTLQKVS